LSLALAFGALAAGCSKKPPLTPTQGPPAKSIGAIDWTLMPAGVKIGVIADPDLNTGPAGGGPAALMVCLYQLSDPGWFASNMKTSEGLAELAACPPGDPPGGPAAAASAPVKGLVSAERYFFQPGERRDLVVDRQPGTQYVGVAGGFMTLPAQGGAAFLPVPVYHKHKLIFADTYEPMELRSWLALRSQLLAFYPKSEGSYDLGVDDINPDGTVKKREKERSGNIAPPPAYLPCPIAWTLKPGETLVCPAHGDGQPTAPIPAPAPPSSPQGAAPAPPSSPQGAASAQAASPQGASPQGSVPAPGGQAEAGTSIPPPPQGGASRQARTVPVAGVQPPVPAPPAGAGDAPDAPSRALSLPSGPATASRSTAPPRGAAAAPPPAAVQGAAAAGQAPPAPPDAAAPPDGGLLSGSTLKDAAQAASTVSSAAGAAQQAGAAVK
jgi:predicted component of type VI protein secretion system